MARTIVWTDKALNDYLLNIDYLLIKWSEKDAQNFIDALEERFTIILVFPEAYIETDFEHTRKCVVCKQITLFYKAVHDDIIILRLWNNYQNPSKLKI